MKPRLTFWQIVNMNVGFFGIQFSFGLQQSNMSPIYKYLGADEGSLPFLWLAGPMTGLLVQPLIGALSDRTTGRWGRRTPYFLVGAILCSLCLLAMPYSSALWMAAGILWILDAANNVTMEPYRAYVSDRLDVSQHSAGFLTQSAFTGLGQTLAYLSPSIMVAIGIDKDAVNAHNIPQITVIAFLIGAVCSISSILWSLRTTPELPLGAEERSALESGGRGLGQTWSDIVTAFSEMPPTMRQLALMKFFQWYGMICYWQYIVLSLSTTLYGTTDPASQGFRDAGLLNGRIGGFYNFVACLAALAMVPLARRVGARGMHSVCLSLAGCGMVALPLIHDPWLLLVPMVGIGLAWGSIMGNPYIMLAGSIPKERVGVYMGIFNMFIVIPMLIQTFTLPLIYHPLLAGNPENVVRLAGALLIAAAALVWRVKVRVAVPSPVSGVAAHR
jgi:maltose/moltooligosaccharide transporter